MKELQADILNDYEHRIARAIEHYANEEGFPDMAEARIERKALDDYLYEYQRILDSEGSQKAQLTKYGIIAIVPVLIMSAFPESMLPWGKYSLIAGVVIGVLLAILLKGLSMLMVKTKLRRLKSDNANLSDFADRVERYSNDRIN